MGLPIVNLGKIIGALLLFSSEPEAFSELDVAIADRVCSQIAGAISGAGVFADLKQTESDLAVSVVERSNIANQNEVIAEIGRVISSTLNIEEVYELYADQVRKLIDYDVLGIAVIDPEGGSFRMAHRVGDELLGKTVGSHFPINGTLIGEVAVTGAAKIVQGFSKPQLQKIYPVIVSTYES